MRRSVETPTNSTKSAMGEVEPYQSASTPQDRENRTYWYGFLRGPSAKTVRLMLRDASGVQTGIEVRRSGKPETRRQVRLTSGPDTNQRTPISRWRAEVEAQRVETAIRLSRVRVTPGAYRSRVVPDLLNNGEA
jgi:hypothetical protein